MSETARQRFVPRSRASVRKQEGPTREEELGAAKDRLIASGRPPSSFGSVDKWNAAVQADANAAVKARGPMAYDTARGELIPSPRARFARLGAEMDAAEAAGADARKKGEEDWKKQTLAEIAFEGPGRARKTEEGSMYQSDTPSGGYVSARSGSKNGIDVAKNMQASMWRDADEAKRAEAFQKGLASSRQVADKNAADRLSGQLAGIGVNMMPTTKDGRLDVGRAEGMLASAKRDQWATDARLDRLAVLMERDARRELSDLRRSKRNRYGKSNARAGDMDEPTTAARMRQLELNLSDGEKSRSGLNPGFWRTEAESEYRNQIAEVKEQRRSAARARARAEVQDKQAAAVRREAESKGRPLTDEEIKRRGYPAWDDEVGWQERMKTDPNAVEIYNMRPVNVSRAGRAMSRVLSAAIA